MLPTLSDLVEHETDDEGNAGTRAAGQKESVNIRATAVCTTNKPEIFLIEIDRLLR